MLLLFFLNSCEKDQLTPAENVGLELLSKEIYSDELWTEYCYNEQHLLKEMKSKFFYTAYFYNSENQLIRTEMYEDPRIYSSSSTVVQEAMARKDWVSPQNTSLAAQTSYYYSSGRLQKTETHRISTDSKWVSSFELNEKAQIVKQIFNDSDKPTGYKDYQYDAAGNLILCRQYYLNNGNPVLSSSTSYEYDRMKNPFKVFSRLMLPGQNTNENNIVKETLTLTEKVPGFDQVQVSNSVYEYNRRGYPVLKDNLIRYEYW